MSSRTWGGWFGFARLPRDAEAEDVRCNACVRARVRTGLSRANGGAHVSNRAADEAPGSRVEPCQPSPADGSCTSWPGNPIVATWALGKSEWRVPDHIVLQQPHAPARCGHHSGSTFHQPIRSVLCQNALTALHELLMLLPRCLKCSIISRAEPLGFGVLRALR